MIFVYRAAMVSLVTFASTLAGFGVQLLLPASYVTKSKDMIGSVVGLDATLLALVLGLLIWTSHGLFTAQQGQLQTIGRSFILLDLAFAGYGPGAAAGRRELRESVKRARARFWIDDPRSRRVVVYSDISAEVLPMLAVFDSLRPTNDAQRQHLAAARDLFGTIVDTQLTMIRSLVNPVPNLLLTVVVGWACVLFFGYGLMSAINVLTAIMAALGALSVGSAAFLMLELSDPYVGLFKMPLDAFEGLMKALTPAEAARNNDNFVR
jgi:predicted membrane chloride channel (bestrophin family)